MSPLAAVSPRTGSVLGGTAVTISGKNLSGATKVAFGKVDATSFACRATTCSAVAPPGAPGRLDVRVTTTEGTSKATSHDRFAYASTNELLSGQKLTSGEQPVNPHDGDHLEMQQDGNLVLDSSSGKALWQAGTEGNPGDHLVLQRDGNLVLYAKNG